MPKKLKPGDRVNGYEIVEELNVGGLAISYAAKSSSGEKVFFKLYKSPTVLVSWYRGYVEYQLELKRRIESGPAKQFTYRFIDFFEAEWGCPTYFQVFEFVERGHDLEQILEQIRRQPSSFTWEQRLTFAKVMLGGVSALHEAGVVHCDLKPANIQLFKDESLTTGYRLKVIDMDYSILSDRRAPWHGEQGYVGSPGYFSPEHLTPAAAPHAASDVFTCGVILYELLSPGHPYQLPDDEAYQRAVKSHTAKPPRLLGAMPPPANDAEVAGLLHRCLAPDPNARPTATEVNRVLNGRLRLDEIGKSRPTSSPAPVPGVGEPRPGSAPAPTSPRSRPPTSAPSPPPPRPNVQQLELLGETGRTIRCNVRTEVGKHLCAPLGEDSKFMELVQFVVERNADGQWVAKPNTAAKNETLVNGKALAEPTPLTEGDVIAVGREAKGIAKLPLKVRLV